MRINNRKNPSPAIEARAIQLTRALMNCGNNARILITYEPFAFEDASEESSRTDLTTELAPAPGNRKGRRPRVADTTGSDSVASPAEGKAEKSFTVTVAESDVPSPVKKGRPKKAEKPDNADKPAEKAPRKTRVSSKAVPAAVSAPAPKKVAPAPPMPSSEPPPMPPETKFHPPTPQLPPQLIAPRMPPSGPPRG